ncbi:MAG: ImmA/IrrE family metallo-endopeptidase, partial [Planctomycetaceae bacterium]|nr:ImmA/IrrE family metallo-endopeptidase [Planctomycetaceae bacterium]
ILLMDTDEKLDGFSGYRGSNPVLVLNKQYVTDRLRFTALHEVGHLLLKIAPHFPEKEQEKICHRFAGAMLVPEEVFVAEFGGNRNRLTQKELTDIKEGYGISIAAIMARAKDLKLISDLFYRSFRIKYNKWGWRKQEPGAYATEETSNRFEQLLQRAAAIEVLSLSKCAALAKKTLVEFRREVEFIS